MFSTLKSALRRTSPADIQNVLTSAQPFISDGPTAEAADRLTNHLTSLTEAATKALTDALAEGEADPRTLELLATQYAEFSVVPEVATLLSELRKTMGALQQTMRDKLRAALAQTQLAPMREALDEARKFELGGAVLVAEVSAVQRKFDALSKAITRSSRTASPRPAQPRPCPSRAALARSPMAGLSVELPQCTEMPTDAYETVGRLDGAWVASLFPDTSVAKRVGWLHTLHNSGCATSHDLARLNAQGWRELGTHPPLSALRFVAIHPIITLW